MGAGMPGVYIMATLPEWGRRGLGKAVMAHMITEAINEGHKMIALTAGDKGAEQLGGILALSLRLWNLHYSVPFGASACIIEL